MLERPVHDDGCQEGDTGLLRVRAGSENALPALATRSGLTTSGTRQSSPTTGDYTRAGPVVVIP